MNEKTVIGPIEDLRTLIEILPVIRKFSSAKPMVVLSTRAEPFRELLKDDPNIENLIVSDSQECTINLQKADPLDVVFSEGDLYIYPWIYIPEKDRAKAQKKMPQIRGPRVVVLSDGFSHGQFLDLKKWIRQVLGVEPDVITLKEKKTIRYALLEVILADLVVAVEKEEALLFVATGIPTVVITEDQQRARRFFRAFFPPEAMIVRDEFGPVVRFCAPDEEEEAQSDSIYHKQLR
ncbi:MAG: hypothetical protein D6778_00015, partial [Nitrospirae bacterium]